MNTQQPLASYPPLASPWEATARLIRRRHRWRLTAYWLATAPVLCSHRRRRGHLRPARRPRPRGGHPHLEPGRPGGARGRDRPDPELAGPGVPAELRAQVVRAERAEAATRRARTRRRGRTSRLAPGQRPKFAVGPPIVILMALGCLTWSGFTEPGLVNAVGYLTGTESTATFVPHSYGQSCHKGGCDTITDGVLERGGTVILHTEWPAEVPLDQPFSVRAPIWAWGTAPG